MQLNAAWDFTAFPHLINFFRGNQLKCLPNLYNRFYTFLQLFLFNNNPLIHCRTDPLFELYLDNSHTWKPHRRLIPTTTTLT